MTMSNERTNLLTGDSRYRIWWYEEYVRPVIAEFLAVTLFVFVGCLSVLQSGGAAPGNSVPFSAAGIALGHGLTIIALVAAFAEISGGHVNPAVTVGALLAGAIGPVKAVFYVIGQLLGGLAGAALTRVVLPKSDYIAIGGGAHNLAAGVSAGGGVLCEVMLTTVLVLTVLMTAVDPKTRTPMAPIAIGVAVAADILAGVLLTGASMNPARSLGPAVVISFETSEYWTYHYVYWVGPLLGALVAGTWYRLFLASSDRRVVCKE